MAALRPASDALVPQLLRSLTRRAPALADAPWNETGERVEKRCVLFSLPRARMLVERASVGERGELAHSSADPPRCSAGSRDPRSRAPLVAARVLEREPRVVFPRLACVLMKTTRILFYSFLKTSPSASDTQLA